MIPTSISWACCTITDRFGSISLQSLTAWVGGPIGGWSAVLCRTTSNSSTVQSNMWRTVMRSGEYDELGGWHQTSRRETRSCSRWRDAVYHRASQTNTMHRETTSARVQEPLVPGRNTAAALTESYCWKCAEAQLEG